MKRARKVSIILLALAVATIVFFQLPLGAKLIRSYEDWRMRQFVENACRTWAELHDLQKDLSKDLDEISYKDDCDVFDDFDDGVDDYQDLVASYREMEARENEKTAHALKGFCQQKIPEVSILSFCSVCTPSDDGEGLYLPLYLEYPFKTRKPLACSDLKQPEKPRPSKYYSPPDFKEWNPGEPPYSTGRW